jgi:glycosyltransferase involved in cell wall biosynthesis
VNSCLTQAFVHEIVVVDDCSTDETPFQIAQLARELFPLVKAAKTPTNSGAATARNCGGSIASGEFLCFLDSDDEYLPGYFRTAVSILDNHSQFSATRCGMQFINANNDNVLTDRDPRYLAAIASSPCNLMLRRSSYDLIGGFPEDDTFRGPLGGEDVAFSKALEQFCHPIGYLPQPFYRCHDRPQSHLQRFLNSTALTPDGRSFTFTAPLPEQQPGGSLEHALTQYLDAISERANHPNVNAHPPPPPG